MRRIATQLLLAGGLLAALPACALAAAKGSVPSNFVRHVNNYWTWYAPKHWVASYGANGIDITSPVGDDYSGLGFSSAQCPSANSPKAAAAKYFKAVRPFYRQQGTYDSKPLRRSHYTKVARIKHLPSSYYGPYGYRQKTQWAGKRKDGDAVRGEVYFDWFYDPGSASCGEATQARSAPKSRYARILKTLRQIESLLFYHPH